MSTNSSSVTPRVLRRRWPYVLWLVLYLPTAMTLTGARVCEWKGLSPADYAFFVVLYLPVVLTVVQVVSPTLVGWILQLLLASLIFGLGSYLIVLMSFAKTPLWTTAPLQFWLLTSYFLGYGVVTTAMFSDPPRRLMPVSQS